MNITVNEQSESIPDCSFHSSIASFASVRSYHQNLFMIISRQYNEKSLLQKSVAEENEMIEKKLRVLVKR